MKTSVILCGILAAATTFAADWFKAEKIEGDGVGFLSLRRPFATWAVQDAQARMDGAVTNLFTWGDVEKIQVLHSMLATGAESLIHAVLSDTEFLKELPDGMKLRAEHEDTHLSFQALLKLRDGTYALLSVSAGFAVFERQRKFGLVQWRRPKS